MSTTTETSSTPPEGQGSTTGNVEGAGNQPAKTDVTFSQAQVDEIVKGRLAEQSKKLTAKHEKELTDKIAAAVSDANKNLDATVESRVQEKLNEAALTSARSEIQAEFGLTDAQLERVKGATPDELKTDAETLFGSLKTIVQKKPPTLQTGSTESSAPLDLSQMSPAEIREKGPEIMRGIRFS